MSTKQIIVIRRDLKMRRGKEIAQGAHAAAMWQAQLLQRCAQGGLIPVLSDVERDWIFGQFTKVVLQTPDEASLLEVCEVARAAALTTHLVVDAGKTEFNGVPTATCCAIGPAAVELLDLWFGKNSALSETGKLALY